MACVEELHAWVYAQDTAAPVRRRGSLRIQGCDEAPGVPDSGSGRKLHARSEARGRIVTIKVGDRIPYIDLWTWNGNRPESVNAGAVLGQCKVVLFAVPGRLHTDLLGLPPARLRPPSR